MSKNNTNNELLIGGALIIGATIGAIATGVEIGKVTTKGLKTIGKGAKFIATKMNIAKLKKERIISGDDIEKVKVEMMTEVEKVQEEMNE